MKKRESEDDIVEDVTENFHFHRKPFYGDSGVSGYNLLEGYGHEDEQFFHDDSRKETPRKITATPYVYREPTKIPPREFLYANHYVREYISATIAPGGLGKTSLVLVEAIAMATQRPLLGVPVPKRLRVWYWNGEDPKEETERRIAAILIHFNIDPKELSGWLFVDTGRNTPICIAERRRNDVIFTPDASALTTEIIRLSIDVFILDPFVKTHSVPENDNGMIDQVARRYATIADEAKCSIELTHHVRKLSNGGRGEYTIDDARGGSALKDAARAVRIFNIMSDEEATTAQIKSEQRRRHFRIDDGKSNMTPPPEAADWFKFVSVPLSNHEIEDLSDKIGVVIAWKLPGVFAGITDVDLPRVQDKIASGVWAKDSQSIDWAGKAIAEVLNIDISEKLGKARVTALLKGWIASGALKVTQQENPKSRGKTRPGVEVGNRV